MRKRWTYAGTATRSPSGRLSRIIPDSGSPLSNVLLVGSGLADGATGNFGSVPAADIAVVQSAAAEVVVPEPDASGSLVVTVTTDAGTSPDNIEFAYDGY